MELLKRLNPTLIIAIGGIIILFGTTISIYGAYDQVIESSIGGIIILIGTTISIYGGYRQGIESSKQTDRIEETLNRETEKLYYPLPSELKCIELLVLIYPQGLSKFLPEIREKFDTNNLLKEYYGKGKYSSMNFSLKNVDNNILKLFDEEEIHISMQIGDKNGPYINENRNLIWTFNAKIFLNNGNTSLSYVLDFENEPKEYFRLNLANHERLDSNGKLRLFKGLKSALELCGQTVHLGFQIGNNQILFPPIISINHLAFKDNNNKDYYIDFIGTTTVRSSNEEIQKNTAIL